MTTTVSLTLGAVSVQGPSGSPPDPVSAVVGDPPQWSDGTDATYATVPNGFDAMLAPIEMLAGTGTVTEIRVTLHCVVDFGDAFSFPNISIAGLSGTAVPDGPGLVPGFVFNEDGHWDLTGIFPAEALPVAAAALNAGTSLRVSSPSAGADMTVYQVTLTVTFEGGVVEEIRVTRQWPRDDAYGAGSATRIHPPPRRGRLVGGQT